MKRTVQSHTLAVFISIIIAIVSFSCCSCQKENRYAFNNFNPYSSERNPHRSAFGLYFDGNKEYVYSKTYITSVAVCMVWNTIQKDENTHLIVVVRLILEDTNNHYPAISYIWLCIPYDNNYQTGEWYSISDTNNAVTGWDAQMKDYYSPLSSFSFCYENRDENTISGHFSSEIEVDGHSYSIDKGIFILKKDTRSSDFSYDYWLNFGRGDEVSHF